MNLTRRPLLLALALACAVPFANADVSDNKPITATVTGGTASGYPRAMIEGLNAVVRDTYAGSAVSFKPNSPGGGIVAVSEGQADLSAMATGTEIRLANEGKFPYKAPLKGKFLFAMQLFDVQYIHIVMTKAWADENGIRSWADIAAKKPKMRLAINRPDNPQTTIGGPYAIMEAHGFTIEDIEKWGGSYVLGNSSTGLAALTDGKADVFMNVRNLGDASLKDVASKRELLWIDDTPAKMQEAADKFDFKVGTIPKGTYPFVEKDYPTVQQWIAMVASADASEETVYKYVKAIAENQDRVQKIGGSLTNFSAEAMIHNAAKLPMHPGALRYYKERGWIK